MSMKGARAVASAVLLLTAVCAVPAISAAQDPGMTTDTTATTPSAPADPGTQSTSPDPTAEGPAAGTPHEPPQGEQPTADDSLGGDSPPADAPSGGGSSPVTTKVRKSASASVSIGDNFYSPASVSVTVGDTVTWRNNGQAQHSATANDGSFDTGVFGPGGSRSATFDSAGTFSYYCTVHGQVQSGTVRVLAASGGESGGAVGGGGGPATRASGESEAAAVGSPDAAGDANTLPATGMAAGGLALVGSALLASGLVMRRRERRETGRQLTLF
jgi:LPXTG-motif cell wall-anchored protein